MNLNPQEISNFITGCILEPINDLANNNPKILYNHFDKLLSIYPVSNNKQMIYNNIITKILENGYKLTTNKINVIVEKHININIFKYKIEITNDIINLCLQYCNDFLLVHIFDHKIVPTSEMFSVLFTYDKYKYDPKNCIKLFLQYGYVFTYNDFILMTKHYIVLDNDINFNINDLPKEFITDEFIQLCEKFDFYPKYYKPSLNFLREKAFTLHKVIDVNEYKKYLHPNLQPDMQCLINACQSSGKKAIQFFVEECHLIPNNDCLLAVLLNDKAPRRYIIEKYIEFHPNQ